MRRLLDLFCGAGGAGMGYHRAGFEVVGIDIEPQPRYPFEFHQADALGYLAGHCGEFDAVHASPPCQRYSVMSSCRPGLSDGYPDLIAPTRAALGGTGLPWVIENVVGSPVRPDVTLCGQMFGLPLYRHRVFESSEALWQPAHPRHETPGSRAGHWTPGHIISVSGNCAPIALAREAMGIHWMRRDELAEAIPPAYTEFVGKQLLRGRPVTDLPDGGSCYDCDDFDDTELCELCSQPVEHTACAHWPRHILCVGCAPQLCPECSREEGREEYARRGWDVW